MQASLTFTFTYGLHHGKGKWRYDNFQLASPTSGELRTSSSNFHLSITFEITENGGVHFLEETMVFQSCCIYFEANCPGGGEESLQDEACDKDDEDENGDYVAVEN